MEGAPPLPAEADAVAGATPAVPAEVAAVAARADECSTTDAAPAADNDRVRQHATASIVAVDAAPLLLVAAGPAAGPAAGSAAAAGPADAAAATTAAAAAAAAAAATATATFSLGCFWQPDLAFSRLRGVREVVCGYTGGAKPPRGTSYGDNVEAVQIKYAPAAVSWAELLAVFWREQDATDASRRRKYASVIWYNGKRERVRAEAAIKAAKAALRGAPPEGRGGGASAARRGRSGGGGAREIQTTAEKLRQFWAAPEKHQKYLLKKSLSKKGLKYDPNEDYFGQRSPPPPAPTAEPARASAATTTAQVAGPRESDQAGPTEAVPANAPEAASAAAPTAPGFALPLPSGLLVECST